MMDNLLSTWQALAPPSTPQTWTATRISSIARVARLANGGAALLVRRDDGVTEERYRLRTAHVELVPLRELTIRTDEGSESGSYLVFSCDGDDDALVRQFLRMTQILPLDSTTAAAAEAAAEMFELFRSLQRRGAQSIQGLWAELLLVARSTDPAFMVAAWHSDNTDIHDFVAGDTRFEVKSSTRGLREHQFSLDQLETDPDNTTIGSLLLEAEPTGLSVFDLLNELRERLPTFELRHRAERLVAMALGDNWPQAEEVRFAPEAALMTLQLFPATLVPRPPRPLPVEVSAVSFRVDLSGIDAVVDRSPRLIASLPVSHV